jgi:hypothetical protein
MGANWSLWADIPHTELWRAIALSLDIEPSELPGYDRSSVRDPIFTYPFFRCSQKFRDRLEIAGKHLGRTLTPEWLCDPEWNSAVELKELSRWAATLNNPWDFPTQFPKIQAVSKISTDPVNAPSLSFHSKEGHSELKDLEMPSAVAFKKELGSSRGWFETHGEYVIEIQRVNKCSKVKDLYAALVNAARAGDSPFEIGSGENRGALVIKSNKKTLAFKTLANKWSDIRMMAHDQNWATP